MGQAALALTDHGNMYAAIEFYQECQKAEIKPIIGVEAYVATRTRFDKEPNLDNRRYHLTLLAKNLIGYRNLIKLVTASYLEGYYYKPRIDKELMRAHSDGLVCLSGCPGGELSKTLWNKDYAAAEHVVREHQEIFGPENYYLELMHHPKLERQTEIREETIKLAHQLGIPLVATQDSHYLEPDDAPAQHTLIAIQSGSALEENRRFNNTEEDFSLISEEQMREYFAATPEAVDNTAKIADACTLELTLGKFVFPHFPIPAGETGDSLLEKLAFAGLKERGLADDQEAIARLRHELGVIAMKGYASYFLVVEDLIRYARLHNIYYNIRGSVAGSITTYALQVTAVNPLTYRIPFERFLNPDRPSAPDIDMDFADNRRDEIIAYARQKYGEDKVAQIGTFGSMMARGAVRDMARALDYPYSVGDKISRLIPMGSQGFPMSIARALEITPELREAYEKDADTKRIIDLSRKIEGNARHISVHAAGVVISPGPLTDYVPLQYDPKGGKIITQYDMYAVGEDGVGLTKFDFLGLRNLTILSRAVELVEKIHQLKIDLDKIPLDDKKTFAMLARGETIGLFQLNGSGMTKHLKELKPTAIHDINAMVALYRPGPIQFIPDYIARKHNPHLIKYLDPALENILKQTYGILVYQDDLLIMAHDLAGYTWGEVDKFRKAVGKKIPAEMAKQKEKFIKGCVEHSGWSQQKATEVWTWIEPFAAYGFNKAHSVSYGRVAYQTAYLKANFPAEYMTSVLSAESGNIETVAEAIVECQRMGIPVLPPDLNESFEDFTVVKANLEAKPPLGGLASKSDKIRFGLITIKNLGESISQTVVAERKKHGPFQSLADFLERIHDRNLNRKSLEALIKSGALDSFHFERGALLANLDNLISYHQSVMKEGQGDSLFGLMNDQSSVPTLKLREAPPASAAERLAWEKELLGLYITGHPLDPYRNKFEQNHNTIKKAKEARDGAIVVVGGLIESVRPINTKKGDAMAFVKITDFTGSIEVVAFPRVLAEFKSLIVPEQCLALRGRLSIRNGEPSIILEGVKAL